MLEGIKFRRLENGYTIKYYLLRLEPVQVGTMLQPKFAGELYVTDKEQLKTAVNMLIEKHLETAEVVKGAA